MATTSAVNTSNQNYKILIHYSLSDKTFVHDTLAPKMISDMTPTEENKTMLLQGEHKGQICFQQQTEQKSSDENCVGQNLIDSESVIVVASETYIKHNNTNNELKRIAESCFGSNKKPLVVIALDSVTAQTLRRRTSLKASNILVWGSPNFWQNVSRNLMTKYQTFNNNKLTNLSLSSPNKKKALNSDDDEVWTYLKTNSERSNRNTGILSSDNVNRLSLTTLKDNMKHMQTNKQHQNSDGNTYTFNLPSSTLQSGKRKQYLRCNPTPSSTPTSRRTSQPQAYESPAGLLKSRSPPSSNANNKYPSLSTKNIHENPFDSYRFDQFSPRKPPAYPHIQTTGINSNSDSDYMSVNDSLATRNEPIYHTLDDEQQQQQPSFNSQHHRIENGDQTVYINSKLEVVYPTASLLRQQRQKLLELQRQNQYLKHRQRNLQHESGQEQMDDDDMDEEFDELLGGNLGQGFTDDDQEDAYENGDENDIDYYGIDRITNERKASCASTNYVPSPAPGSYPRNRASPRNGHHFVVNGGQYGSNCLAGSNTPRLAAHNSSGSKKGGGRGGSYYV